MRCGENPTVLAEFNVGEVPIVNFQMPNFSL